jgi:hypothetical protein
MNYGIKNELQNIISGNESLRKGSIIQSITDYLRRSKKTSANAQRGQYEKQEETEHLVTISRQILFG